MSKTEYIEFRNRSYELVNEISINHAKVGLHNVHSSLARILDDIDQMGYILGYLNPETNEEL